jgi:hypothetical protein
MSKKNKIKKKKLRKLQEQSDKRTADFVARRLESIEEEISDLIPDLQTFNHYSQIMQIGWCLRILADLKKKYRKYSDGHTWDDEN